MTRIIKFRVWDRETSRMSYLKQRDYAWLGETVMMEAGRYELMQFTGLLDKNGKEIYEGDIFIDEWREKTNDVVVFWEGCFCAKWDDGRGHIFNPKKIEVIGNIYENPELLSAHN